MNKVKVTRHIPLSGNPFFKVQCNGETVNIWEFKIDVSPDNIYNEVRNRLQALELAARLENGTKDSEEVIYESE